MRHRPTFLLLTLVSAERSRRLTFPPRLSVESAGCEAARLPGVEDSMNRLILMAAAMITAVAACASNKAADEPGTRIRDSSTTTQDTVDPN